MIPFPFSKDIVNSVYGRRVFPLIAFNPLKAALCFNVLCSFSLWCMNAALMSKSPVLQSCIMLTIPE